MGEGIPWNKDGQNRHTDIGVKVMREEETKPSSWEITDPKLPVIRSGHMENRKK